MNRLLLFCILVTILSCSTKQRIGDRNIEIAIQDAQSQRYNLNKGVVTVYYLSKPPTEIAFHLSPKEKEQIIEQYYALELNKLEDNTSVQEECMDMPKLYTTIHMKSATRTQKIRIDEDCTSFSAKEARKARRVKQFLRVVHRILGTKPEIKTPPMSDIFYI